MPAIASSHWEYGLDRNWGDQSAMMDLLAGIGGGLFVLSSLVVGLRTLLLGLKTRGMPELMIGGGLFLLGGIGYPLIAVAQFATPLSDEVRGLAAGTHMICNVVGVSGIAFFIYRVFRPTSSWALALFVAIACAESTACGFQLLGAGGFDFAVTNSGPWYSNLYVVCVTLTWAGVESFLHAAKLQKREALGLADPEITNRIQLWGCAMSSAGSITLATVTLEAMGIQVSGTALGGLLVGPLGVTASVCLWLAFMPPERYLQWLKTRSAST